MRCFIKVRAATAKISQAERNICTRAKTNAFETQTSTRYRVHLRARTQAHTQESCVLCETQRTQQEDTNTKESSVKLRDPTGMFISPHFLRRLWGRSYCSGAAGRGPTGGTRRTTSQRAGSSRRVGLKPYANVRSGVSPSAHGTVSWASLHQRNYFGWITSETTQQKAFPHVFSSS